MKIQFRNYTNKMRFTKDYELVRDFLIRVNEKEPVSPNFLWGRWEWMFSLPCLDEKNIGKIGIWQDGDKIVALATYESSLGYAYFVVDKGYEHLKKEMLMYARDNLNDGKVIHANIADTDTNFQHIAKQMGFVKTDDGEQASVITIDKDLSYDLEKGFEIVSLKDEFDIKKYGRVLYRGFDHGDNPPDTEEEYNDRKVQLSGPHNNMDIKIAVKAPNGEFVSFCGMWYDNKTENALVEPVATDPKYRKRGLGKAAVLEGIIRCGKLGAKRAYVGSSQQFYKNIGFDTFHYESWWKLEL